MCSSLQYSLRSRVLLSLLQCLLLCWFVGLFVDLSQEDKEALFDSVDTLSGVLQVATGVLSSLTVRLLFFLLIQTQNSIFFEHFCKEVHFRQDDEFYLSKRTRTKQAKCWFKLYYAMPRLQPPSGTAAAYLALSTVDFHKKNACHKSGR